MKTLLVLRHGHAESPARSGDKARQLSAQGLAEAQETGLHIRDIRPPVDVIVSSDAFRARQTAAEIESILAFEGEVVVEPRIYIADMGTLYEVVHGLPDSSASALLVGHNPSLLHLVSELAEGVEDRLDLPTGGLAHLEFPSAERWRDIRPGTGRLVEMHRPALPEV